MSFENLIRKLAAIIALVLVVSAIAGCTITPTVEVGSQQNQARYVSTAYPTSGYSQLVQGVIDAHRERRFDFDTYTVKWINNTAAQTTGILKSGEGTSYHIMTENIAYIHFPTVEAASAYFDSLRPQYPKKNANISQGEDYYAATGKLATVVKQLNNDNYKDNDYSKTLTQQDALITQRAVTFEYPNIPTNQA